MGDTVEFIQPVKTKVPVSTKNEKLLIANC